MNAKFVSESIGKILKPKTKKEIDDILNNDPNLLIKYGVQHNDLQKLFKGIKLGGSTNLDPHFQTSPSTETMLARFLSKHIDQILNKNLSTKVASQLLIHSIKTNFKKLAIWSINQGAYVNFNKTRNKNSVLHLATRFQTLGIIRILLKNGANVNYQNEDGYTPLMTALKPYDHTPNNKLEIFKEILKYEPDLDLKAKHGESIYDLITSPNNRQILDWVNKNNLIDYSIKDISNIIQKGSIKMIKEILEKQDVDLNKKQFIKYGEKVKAIDLINVSEPTAAGKMDYLISKGAELTDYMKNEIYDFINSSNVNYFPDEIRKLKKFANKHNIFI